MTAKICLGAIAGSFGVNGEVRLKSFCADPAVISDFGPLSTEDGSQEYNVKILRPVKNGFAARLTGIKTKEQADALRGTQLFTDRDKLPSLPDDEYYHTDLIGLTMLDTGGTELGTVKGVQNHGAGDLIEVQVPDSLATILVPFTLAAVPTVDLTSGRIIADPPDGLFSK
ncbi:MAG: ribosome maturation factor RimM [Paracoccaceae bacterium]